MDLSGFLLTAIIRIDCATKRKHSYKHLNVNPKVILNSSKVGHKVRKTVKTQGINNSKVDLQISSQQNTKRLHK